MCGRFSQIKSAKDLEYYYGFAARDAKPSFNIAPTQSVTVVSNAGIETMKWGLIPVWAKNDKVGYPMINARAETLLEKGTFKAPFLAGQRILVPATGFYEWRKSDKTPYNIFVKEQEIFSMAGIYIVGMDKDGNERKTFAIITTAPNQKMSSIHDRMPVILSREEEHDWLKGEDSLGLLPLLDAYPDESTDMYVVGEEVGNVRNNYPELLRPVAA